MSKCNNQYCLNNCFIESPIFSNWIEFNKPTKSFIISSPYFKRYAIDEIIKVYGLAKLNCNIDTRILIRGRLEDFIQGSSDISALDSLIRLKNINIDNIMRLTNLHMKAYLVDDKKILIGSGNCTQSGLFAKRT